MITYIIRRLLYSILVLIAASFLVFTFVAKGAGDPLGSDPRRAQRRPGRARPHRRGEAPQRLRLRALRLLGAGRGHGQLRHGAARQPADPARALARDEEHAAARDRRRAPSDPDRDRHRRALRVTPVLGLRLHGDDLQLSRLSDAALLARADARGAQRADPKLDGRTSYFPSPASATWTRAAASASSSTAPTTSPCRCSC